MTAERKTLRKGRRDAMKKSTAGQGSQHDNGLEKSWVMMMHRIDKEHEKYMYLFHERGVIYRREQFMTLRLECRASVVLKWKKTKTMIISKIAYRKRTL